MPKKKSEKPAVPRVALYIRVSSQEQAIKGLSLEAQQEDLEAYTRAHGWVIQGVYVDAGKTARKSIVKRESFQQMLEAVKRDEVDMILFTRLDRWFRSVADYYKVIEVLEAHHCGWLTTQEEYDTTTAGGRLYINLKLSIAQNEADLCGERIKAVLDSKVNHGTAVCGSVPFGYRIGEDKHLEVVPEKAAIIVDAFEHYKATVSLRATVRHIRETYDINWCIPTVKNILRNRLYTGCYDRNGRVNEEFCPAMVPADLFEVVQGLLNANVKMTPSGRVYLFSSMLVCDECGHKLAVRTARDHVYYRCLHYAHRALCTHNHNINEARLETWLLEHLSEEVEKYRSEWEKREMERKRAAASVDRTAIKRKLERLEKLYVNSMIDFELYKRDYERYIAQLAELPVPVQERRPNFEAVREVASSNLRATYDTLSREEKRNLWHSIIREIRINNSLEVTRIVFL